MINRIKTGYMYLNGKGFFDLMLARFLMQFLGFGTILLVARLLTPEELGEIKIIQSYSAIFVLLAGFGFNTAVLKICSERSSQADKEIVLKSAVRRSLLTSALTLFGLYFLAYTRVITPTAHIAKWLMIYSIAIPFAVVSELLVVFLQAQKKIKTMARLLAVIKTQSVIVIILCTWIWGFAGFIISTIAAIALGLIPLFWQVRLRFMTARVESRIPRFTSYAVFSMLGNLVSQIGQRGDIFILDHLIADRELIGYYSLATIFTLAAIQATGVVQQIVTPYFSEHSDDLEWVRAHLKLNIMRMIGFGAIMSVAIFFSAWVIVGVFFDPGYRVALVYLAILLVKYMLFSTYAVVGAVMLGLGFMHFNLIVAATSTPLSLLLMYLGLKHFGIIGLAWSAVASSAISAVLFYSMLTIAFRKSIKAKT